jgi:hypothetical protein
VSTPVARCRISHDSGRGADVRARGFTLFGLAVFVVLFAVTWISLPGTLPYLGLYGDPPSQCGSVGYYTGTTYHPASKNVAARRVGSPLD